MRTAEIEDCLHGMDSNRDNHNQCRMCKLQTIQWSKMPDWTRKITTRTQLVHGAFAQRDWLTT